MEVRHSIQGEGIIALAFIALVSISVVAQEVRS
jgi:hypothetical protein